MLNLYNAGAGDGAWYECVDLVRLIAADNEIESLEDRVFPDDNAASHSAEDDYEGKLFGGLETLDFHGNHLKTLPIGLRRLERLTTLNLSKNGLHNDCLEIISHIDCLRELRLADNVLEGMLGSQLWAKSGPNLGQICQDLLLGQFTLVTLYCFTAELGVKRS